MEQGVVWTSGRGCTVSGGLVGGGFWDAYGQALAKIRDGFPLNCKVMLQAPDAVIATLKCPAFAGQMLENERSLLPGVGNDGGGVHDVGEKWRSGAGEAVRMAFRPAVINSRGWRRMAGDVPMSGRSGSNVLGRFHALEMV